MAKTSPEAPAISYVDVDDTLVRSFGDKRIPMPSVVRCVRELSQRNALLYCWSSGGAEYARLTAEQLGIADCLQAFLPKPTVLLDDQDVAEWRGLRQVHPANCSVLLADGQAEEG